MRTGWPRSESIDKLYRNLIGAFGIVCGDFNFENTEPPYRDNDKYLKDAAMVRKMIPPNTFSSNEPSKRIDYAFVTKRGNWKVINAEVFPVNYSDHMPVLFTLRTYIAE